MSIRAVFLAAVVAGLIVGGTIAGVRAAGGDGDSSTSPSSGTTGAASGSPRATAEAFAKAWSAGDVPSLYLLLHADAQLLYPLAGFTAAYNSFASETTQTGLSAKVTSVSDGSAGLSVRLATAYFGDFEYTISLNLVRGADNWLVAWEPADIHPEMTEGRTFKSTIQRPRRGTIFDRSDRPLAITRDVRFLGLNRAIVTDRATLTAAVIGLGLTKGQVDAAFASTLGANQRVQVGPIADAQAEAALQVVRAVPGALLYFESQRVHPLGSAGAHVVGYTRELTAEELARHPGEGLRAGDRTGAVGLEATMETQLAGKVGAALDLVDTNAQVVKRLKSREFVQGQDVRTTLDANVLVASQTRLGARSGASVVIDPRSNAILALNSSPSFDPDAFERNDAAALAAITASAGKPLANRATTGLYSAGSTFKLITGAAGLGSGLYKPSDRIPCTAVWTGLDPPRKNWEGGQGDLTIAEGLMRSCNPVFYEIALALYNKTDGALSQMARAFGFGAETGTVGLSEEAGLVPDAAWKRKTRNEAWFPGDEVNLGIGQGDLLITPLQLANAYSSFVAGALRAPVLIVGNVAVKRGDIPLAPEQSALLRQGLKLVTSARGTASAAFAFAGYNDFAGKSGTAEDVGTQQHVLFVAYSPADAPRVVAAVVLDDGQSGSIEAGPMARDMVLAALALR